MNMDYKSYACLFKYMWFKVSIEMSVRIQCKGPHDHISGVTDLLRLLQDLKAEKKMILRFRLKELDVCWSSDMGAKYIRLGICDLSEIQFGY